MDIETALSALEELASSPSTSSSGPLDGLLEVHFQQARSRLLNGEDPVAVLEGLQKQTAKVKKEVEKGLKGWYLALGNIGKAVDKSFPPNLGAVSDAYNDPPLFATTESRQALDKVVLASLGRQGRWEAVAAFEEESGQKYPPDQRALSEELHSITDDIESGNLRTALSWCEINAAYLDSPPHPSSLPYFLHRAVFLSMPDKRQAMIYAHANLMTYVPTHPVLQLLTSCLYPSPSGTATPSSRSAMDMDIDDELPPHKRSPYSLDPSPLVGMFKAEFCRRHGWPKEEPLEVVVDLGSRGGALNAIEKARRVMGERLGNVRSWTDLPMEIPLPPTRRYHSVFVCPVSKEQATEVNPPTMLSCGHVVAAESLNRLLKGGRRSAKCPYCPVETSLQAAQRLYF